MEALWRQCIPKDTDWSPKDIFVSLAQLKGVKPEHCPENPFDILQKYRIFKDG